MLVLPETTVVWSLKCGLRRGRNDLIPDCLYSQLRLEIELSANSTVCVDGYL